MLHQTFINLLVRELIQQYHLAFQIPCPGKIYLGGLIQIDQLAFPVNAARTQKGLTGKIGRASCRESVCLSV